MVIEHKGKKEVPGIILSRLIKLECKGLKKSESDLPQVVLKKLKERAERKAKIQKDDIEVIFYENDANRERIWEAKARFNEHDVHRQFAIVFKTPPYRDENLTEPVDVLVMLHQSRPVHILMINYSLAIIPLNLLFQKLMLQIFRIMLHFPTKISLPSKKRKEIQMCNLNYLILRRVFKCHKNKSQFQHSNISIEVRNQVSLLNQFAKTGHVSKLLKIFDKIIGVEDLNGNNAIMQAIIHQNFNGAILMIENAFDFVDGKVISHHNRLKQTALHLAVMMENSMIVSILLDKKCKTEKIDRNGDSAFHLAAKVKSKQCLSILCAYAKSNQMLGNIIDLKNNNGMTPLHLAVISSNLECIDTLLSHGANVNFADGKCGKRPLHLAILSAAKTLLKKKEIDVNLQTFNGDTALHYAVLKLDINKEIVSALLHHGADPLRCNCDSQNENGHEGISAADLVGGITELTKYVTREQIGDLEKFLLRNSVVDIMNKQAASKSNQNILNKRIPTNPKFNHVKPVVDTEESSVAKECYKKVLRCLCDMVWGKTPDLMVPQNLQNYDEIEDANKDQSEKLTGPMEAKFISVVHGLGEMDLNQSNLIKHEKSDEPLPYLLLDVRHDDSFKQCRIKSAQNYPASMLNRSVNYETKELLQYHPLYPQPLYKEGMIMCLCYLGLPESCSLKTSSIQKKRNSFETKNDSNVRFAENQEFSHEDILSLWPLEHLETLQEQLDHHLNKSSSYGTSMISSSRPTSSKSFRIICKLYPFDIVKMISDTVLIVLISICTALLGEGLTWLLVYRTEKYQKLKSEVEKQSKKLEKKKEVLGDNIDKHHKKKIEREEERLKNNNRDLSLVKMKSMFAIGLAFTALLSMFNSIFDGRVVAQLPFTPFSWIRGLSHRNLPGENYTDCSFIFLYILCTMSIRQVGINPEQLPDNILKIIQKLLPQAPPNYHYRT
ncbi:Calcium load-activated calcium channel [Nymphon striatum]|nr:Calcium load-activated calcium channel [Nymphon striatum]